MHEPMRGLAITTFPGRADFECLSVFTRQLQPTGARLPYGVGIGCTLWPKEVLVIFRQRLGCE